MVREKQQQENRESRGSTSWESRRESRESRNSRESGYSRGEMGFTGSERSYERTRYSSEQRLSAESGGVNGSYKEGVGGRDGSVLSVPMGERDRKSMKARRSASNLAVENATLATAKEGGTSTTRPGVAEEGYFGLPSGKPSGPPRSPLARPSGGMNGDGGPTWSGGAPPPMTPNTALPPVEESSPQTEVPGTLRPPVHAHYHRASSPPAFSPGALSASSTPQPPQPRPDRLTHRHTLEVPKLNAPRTSAEVDGAASTTGRYIPNSPNPTRRRASLQLGRRQTRSVHSDMHTDDFQQDEDAARWAEVIKQKRIERRARQDTDDERVVVGTKVDNTHVNYEMAYNMLTGIRFVVSRNNAKLDRALTDSDFEIRNKFAFDITGNEQTPSTKYDFKFKDYAPWVFRHIRQIFNIDPAEYLMSLTSKYILSELGSPGKSGSFFYFSRDYKYIIKTIHHSEHKFLRKILKDYHNHVAENPNTLLSQFYGLHRVKLPYIGRKVHFVVMNNLFPPHRDIHRTFDLKGSTIGRDFKEDDLEHNPRATLKDLNWLRRNLHLEFGPTKKDAFVAQMQKDVALLQRLKIMDYSLLVGIHDLERGNEENLRDKTLQVFQPGGEKQDDKAGPGAGGAQLARTPSKMENAKRAKELRDLVKKQRPVPMDQTVNKMPDEAHKSSFYFYADDGGFRATHEDDTPGEEIYYLGIIDCLTRYNYIKKAEHFWKGMGGHESQISAIPPVRYGDRFVKFIAGVTMSRERAEAQRESAVQEPITAHITNGLRISESLAGSINDPRLGGVNIHNASNTLLSPGSMSMEMERKSADSHDPVGTEKVMEGAAAVALKSMQGGASEEDVPDRSIGTVRTSGLRNDANTLPVIGETMSGSGEGGSRRTSVGGEDREGRESMSAMSRLVRKVNERDEGLSPGFPLASPTSPVKASNNSHNAIPSPTTTDSASPTWPLIATTTNPIDPPRPHDHHHSTQQHRTSTETAPPPTPPKTTTNLDGSPWEGLIGSGRPPPTPPKDLPGARRSSGDSDKNKELPLLPLPGEEDGRLDKDGLGGLGLEGLGLMSGEGRWDERSGGARRS
ncbi:unnamed protein product [Zymoseptoria tritici ST99CH_1E4]|uniref:1-phosphatidylinositol-4-phosphate 5-kinase n=2 Tax=Zymoseptoria tritici TaxID=1047171 RepID=A0A2H1H3Y5_ZYMTR|nr:unnamed protein product [Zymoseptoria tritici ST99CH_1E4]